jgi:hypothetical protein
MALSLFIWLTALLMALAVAVVADVMRLASGFAFSFLGCIQFSHL